MPERAIDWGAVKAEATDILSRYLQINTTNPPGNETAGALFLKDLLEREGIACDIYSPQPDRGSLVSRFAGREGIPDLLLLHHIDVVPAEESMWQHPPFAGVLIEGELWGRGAIDCKSLGVMELMALVLLKRQGFNPEQRVVYAATADEEAGGGRGVQWLMETRPGVLAARFIINEGVGFGFRTARRNLYFCQVAEKGSCWTNISFTGTPGHGSVPHDDNCVVSMARAIDALARHRFPLCITEPVRRFIKGIAAEQEFMPAGDFMKILDPAHTAAVLEKITDPAFRQTIAAGLKNTAVPTVARAGTKTNVIPGTCSCEIDCRILPGLTPKDMEQTVSDILSAAGCKQFTVQVTGSAASESPADTPLFGVIEACFKKHDPRAKVIPYMSSGATDSRFFRQRGITAYGVQTDASLESVSRIHGHNERIGTEQLTLGVKILYDIIKEFCMNK